MVCISSIASRWQQIAAYLTLCPVVCVCVCLCRAAARDDSVHLPVQARAYGGLHQSAQVLTLARWTAEAQQHHPEEDLCICCFSSNLWSDVKIVLYFPLELFSLVFVFVCFCLHVFVLFWSTLDVRWEKTLQNEIGREIFRSFPNKKWNNLGAGHWL